MRLHLGERLEGAGPESQPGGYVVTAVVRETPWSGLYAARKVFYNFDFNAKRLREADEIEWLEVFLRTVRYPVLDDSHYVAQRRSLARSEARQVLGNRRSNLWPEPIDLLEIENTRDPFTFHSSKAHDTEPIVAFARPHGRFVGDWQRQILPLSAILSVVAELLEFVRQAHDDGLLLQGLGPDTVVIDGSDRVHYLGAEMALSLQSPLLKEETPAESWVRLFPPERFPRGYAAPECFQPGRRPDTRADLYAWGTLAWSLLTGQDPARLAEEQGRPWAIFGTEQFARLDHALSQIGTAAIEQWASPLGIAATDLLAAWPYNLVEAFRLLLSPEVNRRPRSVNELRRWVVQAPPPAVAGLVALHTGAGMARLLLDCSALDPTLGLCLQSRAGTAPEHRSEGVTVYDGPLRPIVVDNQLPLTPETVWYTAFTRHGGPESAVWSAPAIAPLWQPTPANLRRWAEEQAALTPQGPPLPPLVGMVLSTLDINEVADSLLEASQRRLRGWVLWRLEQALRGGTRLSLVEPLLLRLARDPTAELRQQACLLLWQHSPNHDDALQLRIVEALEATPIDAPVALTHFLRRLGLNDPQINTLLNRFVAGRPTECPVCATPITFGDRAQHLRSAHGFLEFEGDVLPIASVLARLWERVLARPDREAHDQLLKLYVTDPNAENVGLSAYVAALEERLANDRAGASDASGVYFSAQAALVPVLRHSARLAALVPLLLHSGRPAVRELAREAILPALAGQLQGDTVTAGDVWRVLESACPGLDLVGERVVLCNRLPLLGVDQAAVNVCVDRLREERLVSCPECRSEVRQCDLETHLRRAHSIHEFRGARGSASEIRHAIVRALCTPPPDLGAWRSLESLVADRHPEDPDEYLRTSLYLHLKAIDAEQRPAAWSALADAIVAGGAAARLVPLFAGPSKNESWELIGRRLALEVGARLSPLIPDTVADCIKPLLSDRAQPRRVRENAALALLRSAGKEGAAAWDVLCAYTAGSGKVRAIEKLRHLEQRFGQSQAIEELCQELDCAIRMNCPRCRTQLTKREMVGHLWDRHRLLLEGQRVREPWRVLVDWVVDYALENDPDLLRRCKELAERDDPKGGLLRLQRLLASKGVHDRDLLGRLCEQAKRQRASLCPSCYTAVPVPPLPRAKPLQCDDGTLEGHGYRLTVSDRGIRPRLTIETPRGILHHGGEPGRPLTRLGIVLVTTLPLLAVAYLVAGWFTRFEAPPALLAALAAGVGIVLAGVLYACWPKPPPARDRLLRAAWDLLVPAITRRTTGPDEWALFEGLLQLGGRDATPSTDLLSKCFDAVSSTGGADPHAAACLATLCRRYVSTLRASGEDALALVASQAADCFRGKLSLAFFAALLDEFAPRRQHLWSSGELGRLRVLIAQEAFRADIRPVELLALGRVYPEVGTLLRLDDSAYWLQLYAIWREGEREPWDASSGAHSVFDLAEESPEDAVDLLDTDAHLLLWIAEPGILISRAGVRFEGECVRQFERGTTVEARRGGPTGWEIVIGRQTIPCANNPRGAVETLRHWLEYWFLDLRPRIPATVPPLLESGRKMWQSARVACPGCGRALVPSIGEVAVGVRTGRLTTTAP